MNDTNILSAIGLVLDIVGALLIYIFPLQSEVSNRNEIEQHIDFFKDDLYYDDKKKTKARRYMLRRLCKQRISQTGFLILAIGFLLQLASLFLGNKKAC